MKLLTGIASLGVVLLTAGSLVASPAAAAPIVVSSASGLTIVDTDGVTIQTPTPAVEWAEGVSAHEFADQVVPTSSSVKNGYDIAALGVETRASDNGARVNVKSATLGLRARVAVTVAGLEMGCRPDGRSFVSFSSLRVGNVDLTSTALAGGAGFTYDLPEDNLGRGAITRLTVNKQTTASSGAVTTAGITLTDGSEMFEVSRLELGKTVCSPHDQAPLDRHRVAGVQVTTADGIRLVDPTPSISSPGAATRTTSSLEADGVRTTAAGVTTTTSDDGSVNVRVDSFQQTPRPGAYAEFYDSALRVNGLTLAVNARGESTVSFDDSSLALFADGKWLNSSNGYIYSKLNDEGTVTLEVKVNERIDNADGTVTINGVHYIDHTGVLPEVILAQATVSVDTDIPPVVTPEPEPQTPVVAAGTWHAYGIRSTGASPIAAAPLSIKSGNTTDTDTAVTVSDGANGQIVATGISVNAGPAGASSTVQSVDLFPGTDAAITLKNLRVSVKNGASAVTSDGGSVFGQVVSAGPIAPGTRFVLPGGHTAATLAVVGTDAKGLTTVSGLRVTLDSGRSADITVAHAAAGKAAAAKLKPAVTASRSPWTVSKGATPTIRIAVKGKTGVAKPTGRVTIVVNGKSYKSVTLSKGATSVKLPKMKKTTKVVVRYLGDSRYLAVASKQYTVKIRK